MKFVVKDFCRDAMRRMERGENFSGGVNKLITKLKKKNKIPKDFYNIKDEQSEDDLILYGRSDTHKDRYNTFSDLKIQLTENIGEYYKINESDDFFISDIEEKSEGYSITASLTDEYGYVLDDNIFIEVNRTGNKFNANGYPGESEIKKIFKNNRKYLDNILDEEITL